MLISAVAGMGSRYLLHLSSGTGLEKYSKVQISMFKNWLLNSDYKEVFDDETCIFIAWNMKANSAPQ